MLSRVLPFHIRVEAEIDKVETESLRRLGVPPDNQVQQIELLGKLMLFDKELSVNRNEACAFCQMPETGFTGPISEFNRTTGSYPGSVRTRFSERKPQTHTYAPLSPVLHYNEGQGDLVDGNFWDMRATGRRLGNPAAEQAEGPPTNATTEVLSGTPGLLSYDGERVIFLVPKNRPEDKFRLEVANRALPRCSWEKER